jgi:hypothetical protein
MATTFNDGAAADYGFPYEGDTTEAGTIAWQDFNNRTGTPGPWSKVHRTTLCGRTVPEAYATDSWSSAGACARCRKAKG